MLLRDLLWEIFQSTGHIGAYLAYRSCVECVDENQAKEHLEITMEYGLKNI